MDDWDGVFGPEPLDADTCARIVEDPDILAGAPTVAGTRVSVVAVLGSLAHHGTFAGVLEDYPHLTPEDVAACVRFARHTVDAARALPSR